MENFFTPGSQEAASIGIDWCCDSESRACSRGLFGSSDAVDSSTSKCGLRFRCFYFLCLRFSIHSETFIDAGFCFAGNRPLRYHEGLCSANYGSRLTATSRPQTFALTLSQLYSKY